jgi:hypothetical protein
MVSIPEGLETLLTNLVMSSCVHEEHGKEHEMASDATRLSVMNLKGDLLANLTALNVDKIDIVCRGVYHGPESHGVSHLSVKPDVLVGREKPSQLGTNDPDDVAQHGDEDEAAVVSEDEAGAARRPYGPFEAVQGSKFLVSELAVPPICEESKVGAVEKHIECKATRSQELPLEPGFTHEGI